MILASDCQLEIKLDMKPERVEKVDCKEYKMTCCGNNASLHQMPHFEREKKKEDHTVHREKERKHDRAQTCSCSCHFLVSHFVLQGLRSSHRRAEETSPRRVSGT